MKRINLKVMVEIETKGKQLISPTGNVKNKCVGDGENRRTEGRQEMKYAAGVRTDQEREITMKNITKEKKEVRKCEV